MSEHVLPLVLACLLSCCAPTGEREPPPPRSPVAPRTVRLAPEIAPAETARRSPGREVAPTVGLVASDDADVTEAIATGVRRALDESRDQGGPDLALLVGERENHWASAAAAAVRMAMDRGAIAVIAPPERRRAHEIAQFGTRAGVPIISTSPAESVTQAGSKWVVCVVSAGGSELDWRAVGYDAGRAAVEAVRRNGLRRVGFTASLAGGPPFRATGGQIEVAENGARRTP